MAFPTVPTVTDGRVAGVNQLNLTATLTGPDLSTLTKAPGDLLIAIAGEYQSNAGTDAAFTGWAGGGLTWNEIRDSTGTSNGRLGVAYARVVTGSETGAVTVTRSGTLVGDASMIVLVVPGAHPTTAPEASTAVHASAAAADVGAFDPAGWGTEDTLWIGVNGNGMTNATGSWTANNSAPTNYTDFFGTNPADTSTIGDFGLAVAFRQLNAASEDMGTFGQDTSNARSSALIIAVRPAPAAISMTLGVVSTTDSARALDVDEVYELGQAAPRPCGDATTGTGSAASQTTTLTESVPVGDTLLAFYNIGSGGGTPAQSWITDSKGNTWQLDSVQQNVGSMAVAIFSTRVTTALVGGTDSVTITPTASQIQRTQLARVIGLKAASWKDQSVGAEADASSSPATTGATSTLAQERELVVQVISTGAGDQAQMKPGSGWNVLGEGAALGPLTTTNMAVAWKYVSATSAVSGNYTWPSSTRTYALALATYRHAGVPGAVSAAQPLSYELATGGSAQHKDLTPASTTASARALDIDKLLTLVKAQTVDTARTLIKPIQKALSVASVVMSSRAQDVDKVVTVTKATEVDTSRTVTFTKPIFKSLGVGTVVMSARAVTFVKPISKTLGVATVVMSARALTFTKTIFKSISPATEVDTAQTASKGGAKTLGVVTVVMSARALIKPIQKFAGVVTTPVSARALDADKSVVLVKATETDTAQAQNVDKLKTLGVVTSPSAAQALDKDKRVSLGTVTTVMAARALLVVKPIFKTLGVVTVVHAAQDLRTTGPIRKTLGIVSVVHSARLLDVDKRLGVTRAQTVDSARALTATKPILKQILQATTLDSALTLSVTHPIRVTLVPAVTIDLARALAFVISGRTWPQDSGVAWPQDSGATWPEHTHTEWEQN